MEDIVQGFVASCTDYVSGDRLSAPFGKPFQEALREGGSFSSLAWLHRYKSTIGGLDLSTRKRLYDFLLRILL